MKIKSNKELKSMIKDGVINCTGNNLEGDFNIDVQASIINARDINARDINALDINAWDINAWDINARDINAVDINAEGINAGDINAGNINAWDIKYYAVCFAYNNISCLSIEGQRSKHKHFCLDGKVIIKKEGEDEVRTSTNIHNGRSW